MEAKVIFDNVTSPEVRVKTKLTLSGRIQRSSTPAAVLLPPVAMISIQTSHIPDNLKNGFFYRALESQDNPSDHIEVPAKCFYLLENEASNIEDFAQILNVMTYWGLNVIPQVAMGFCFKNELASWGQIGR